MTHWVHEQCHSSMYVQSMTCKLAITSLGHWYHISLPAALTDMPWMSSKLWKNCHRPVWYYHQPVQYCFPAHSWIIFDRDCPPICSIALRPRLHKLPVWNHVFIGYQKMGISHSDTRFNSWFGILTKPPFPFTEGLLLKPLNICDVGKSSTQRDSNPKPFISMPTTFTTKLQESNTFQLMYSDTGSSDKIHIQCRGDIRTSLHSLATR